MTPPHALVVFLGAFLAFTLELASARLLLPYFGGSASVWTVCMMFFQGTLLAGYLYARAVLSRLAARSAAKLHLAVLAAAGLALPVSLGQLPGVSDPVLRLLAALAAAAGAPFFVLSATTPMVQSWLERSGPPAGGDGYFLFAASNAGALAALLAYPLLLETLLPLRSILGVWAGVYVLFAALHLTCLPPEGGKSGRTREAEARSLGRISMRTRALWLLAAAGPCAAMLAAANLLTHDFAALPLVWIAPLGIYLLTFILNFKRKPWYPKRLDASFLGLLVACVALFLAPQFRELMRVLGKFFFMGGALFAVGMVCHRALAESRPGPGRAGSFYVWTAAGGWLGSAVVAVGLPLAARHLALLSLDWLAAAALAVSALAVRDWGKRATPALLALVMVALGGAALASFRTVRSGARRAYSLRNFYGVYSVEEKRGLRALYHGNTHHGMQFGGRDRRVPLSYFHPESGLGDVFRLFGEGFRTIGAVGLGTGAVAAHARRGQTLVFYELDPDVETIARRWFTYLEDSAADVRVITGDGRLGLEARRVASFDLLVLDAFNSGAVPVHLLTREAFELYRDRLAEGGVIVLHISNRYLDLAPLLAGHARGLGLAGAFTELKVGGDDEDRGLAPSKWAVLSADRTKVGALRERAGWSPLPEPPDRGRIWTDQKASVLPYLKL